MLLRRGAHAGSFEGEALEDLQRQHHAYLEQLLSSGKLLMAGRLVSQSDEAFRGLCVYGTDQEEARQLAEADPAVMHGRLAVDVFTWRVREGRQPMFR